MARFRWLRGLELLTGAGLSSLPGFALAEDPWVATVSPAGHVRLERNGKEAGSLVPGLFEVPWRSASMGAAKAGQRVEGDLHRSQIRAPGGTLVDVEAQFTAEEKGQRCAFRLTPAGDVKLNSLHVTLELPAAPWTGGTFEADGRAGSLPLQWRQTGLHTGAIQVLRLVSPSGAAMQLDFGKATPVLVQDDRQWGPSFSVRVGPQMGETVWAGGKSWDVAFLLSVEGGMRWEKDGPVSIQAGPDWVPLEASLEIEPGSALDFSQLVPRWSPAGAQGRVVINEAGRFAFAQNPRAAVRFYGVNLCFSALYLDHDGAERLAERLERLGYNALRIHHYEGELVDRSSRESIRLRPDKLDQLDFLCAALKRRGIYLSTDLFVSRPIPAERIYPGTPGELGMEEYKMAVHVNERAFEDFKSFARLLLEHVNPYTGLRYGDDPALAWLSLVNEDNPGNYIGGLTGPVREDWQRAWNRWLQARDPDRKAVLDALGKSGDEQDAAKGNIPLGQAYGDSAASTVFNVFLAEVERDFFERTRRFLRQELGCQAMLTDLNAWHNPVQLQAVREAFDYVDDHFYVDHPEFLEKPWSLPSRCPNTSPIAAGAPGGRSCAFARLFGKPFTITEFNYSSPGRFRGVGGILTGALGAVQDWDGVWRFAYSHSRDHLERPSAMNYFDMASDPLNQAAERASLCLFLRGDLAPARHAVALRASREELLVSPATSRDKTPPWHGLAWLTRVGWSLGETGPGGREELALPLTGGQMDPFAKDSGGLVLAELRARGWLSPGQCEDPGGKNFQSESGEIAIDGEGNTLTLDTARTAGGFAPAGKRVETKAASIEILDTDATVWVSSLDGEPIRASRRLLITHLTDLQNSGLQYGDRRRQILLAWGKLPHLVQAGRAQVTLRLDRASAAKVYRLDASGRRGDEVAGIRAGGGELSIPLSVAAEGKACLCYEVEAGK